MIADVLPRVGNPSDEQRAIGAEAAKLLGEATPLGMTLAGEAARDWQAMIDAALNPGATAEGGGER